MNKYAFEDIFGIQGFNIAWYGVIIACGMLLGVVLATQAAKRRDYKTDLIIDFIMLALPVAILCARAYYVIFEWSSYSKNLIKIFAIWEGGLAIYGGVIGGIIAALVFSKMNKLPFWELIDIAVPSLILGQAIGRWGNFVNQEAYGNLITNPSLQFFPYGVYIQKLTQWHQATFFYESMWNLLIFIVLILYKRKAKYNGDIFARYLIGYGTGRFFIEGLRTDSLYLLPGMRVSQLLSLILIVSGVIFLIIRKLHSLNSPRYTGKYTAS